MELNDFKSRLKSGSPAGWYIFAGEEDYLKKYYAKALCEAVVSEDGFEIFNHAVFEGDDVDLGSVAEAIKSPPMMAEYKLVEWKFADIDSLKEKEKAALESLFELKEEYPFSIFSITTTKDGFDTGTAKRPSRSYTRLSKAFDIITFPKSQDSQLLAWLKRHFDSEGVGVDLATLNALLFRSGKSMEILNNEVNKLAAYAKANNMAAITPAEVELIASPSAECDAFALSNAVVEKNIHRAFEAMADLKQKRTEPPVIIAMLERVYSELVSVALLIDEGKGLSDIETLLKLHSYKAKLYVGAVKKSGTARLVSALGELRRIDASSKSGGMSGYVVIEMFITQNMQ